MFSLLSVILTLFLSVTQSVQDRDMNAPMVYQRENSGNWTAYNIGRDYLGNITHIASADGTPVAEYSYGPYIQSPDFTQNFNRYSYCLNNPLKYTDESGEWVRILIGAIIGGISNLVANWNNCDGFYDSITEMEWFESINNFYILHESLPQIEQIHLYLDILNMTDVWWEIYPENVKIKNELLKNPSEMQKRIEFFVKYFGMEASQVPLKERVIIKNFNVYFKKRDEAFVRDCLAKYSKDYRKRLYYDKSGLIRIK